MALDSLIEQESGWLVPDQALRATLQDTILEDFVKVYQVRLLMILIEKWEAGKVFIVRLALHNSLVSNCKWKFKGHVEKARGGTYHDA